MSKGRRCDRRLGNTFDEGQSDSIGISDKGLFWGRRPLTALNGHLMNLVGPFLALKKKKMLV